jgi:hypothetical protein
MLKIGGRLVTFAQFKSTGPDRKLTKKQRARQQERRQKSKARGILLRPPPVTVPKSDLPFCVFGANGDCAAPAISMGGEHHIYALIDPRDQTVRYIGKTTDPTRRLYEHTTNKSSAREVKPWIAELIAAGLAPTMEVLDRASLEEWERAEQYWIGFYSLRGRLLNTEVGGRGYVYKYHKRMRWAKRRLLGG